MAVYGRVEVASTDQMDSVYKIDYFIQSSLLSSFVLIQYKVFLINLL